MVNQIKSNNQIAAEWYDKANAAQDKQDYAKAIECYKKAIELQTDDAIAYKNMGYIYQKLGEDDKAAECYEKAKDLSK